MVNVDEYTGPDKQKLIGYLQSFITPQRYAKFLEVIKNRTRFLTIVLEDIYQSHNASAVLRTCDCFGIQDVHIIENRNKYEVNPDVALGSSKWLNLITHSGPENNTVKCLTNLKKNGYRIIAATPHHISFTPETLPLDQKTALLFGTELTGLTREALDMADDYIKIPMVGFTESLNISVSVAIFLQTLAHRARSGPNPWQLTEEEQNDILLSWLQQSINKPEMLIRNFNEKEIIRKTSDKKF